MSIFVSGGNSYTINCSNIAALDGKTLLVTPAGGSGCVQIEDDPATLGECRFRVIKDDESSQPVKVAPPTGYTFGGWKFIGLIGYGESVEIACDATNGFRVVGSGNPYPNRLFHRTFVPTSSQQVYSLDWWHRNGITRVNCDVNNLDAMIVLPDPANMPIASGYSRSYRCWVARPDLGSVRSCSVFSTLGYGINNRPQQTPTLVAGGEIAEFEFDNAQWWATKVAYF